MSRLCSHRDYISLDEAELERAAGACEIEAAARVDDAGARAFYMGAGRALRILSCNDVVNYEEFLILMNMEIESASERSCE